MSTHDYRENDNDDYTDSDQPSSSADANAPDGRPNGSADHPTETADRLHGSADESAPDDRPIPHPEHADGTTDSAVDASAEYGVGEPDSEDRRMTGDTADRSTDSARRTSYDPADSHPAPAADDVVEPEVIDVDETAGVDSADRPSDYEVTDGSPPLADLLRQVGRALRRDFFTAIAEEDIDARDVADLRRRRRRARRDDVSPEEPWAGERAHGGDAAAEELRRRVRALRDKANARLEEMLSDDEIASLMTTLTKIADELAPDGDDIDEMRDRIRSTFTRRRGFDRGRGFGPRQGPDGHRHRGRGDHRAGEDADRDGREPRGRERRGDGRGRHERRGGDFEPEFGPHGRHGRGGRGEHGGHRGRSEEYWDGPGRGPRGARRSSGRGGDGPGGERSGSRGFTGPWEGFDPSEAFGGDCDPREFIAQWLHGCGGRGRQESYERGFAEGFEKGFRAGARRDED